MIKNKLLIFLMLFTLKAMAQDRQALQGRVINNGEGLSGVFVINKVTGAETKTNTKGDFILQAKPGDRLVVYSTGTEVREFAVNAAAFTALPYLTEVQLKAYDLGEVVINDSINSVTLGIVKKGTKTITPAERRLKTAGVFKPIMLLGLLGGSLPVDPIINAISGRTKQLKKELALERKEAALEKIKMIYTEKQIEEELKVPAEKVDGFIYYIIEDEAFAAAVKEGNDTFARFLMAGLAEQYLKLQKEEE